MAYIILKNVMPPVDEDVLVVDVHSNGWARCYSWAQKWIKWVEAATVDEVDPVRVGSWIWDDEGYHCSACFYHAYGDTGEVLSGHWCYCPSCGAKMEEQDGT